MSASSRWALRAHAAAQWWERERQRGRGDWTPVLFAGGIELYFICWQEPGPAQVALIAVSLLALAAISWRQARAISGCALGLLAGFLWIYLAAHRDHGPVLAAALEPRQVTGTVEDILRVEKGVRLVLRDVQIARLDPKQTPRRVRLSLRQRADDPTGLPRIGDVISLTAGLRPPMGPVLPGSYDFARHFYFQDIGAIGYGLPPWSPVARAQDDTLSTRFRNWRFVLSEEILRTLGVPQGAVAAGLITGDARAIPRRDFEDLRASNLYHIIAISGEHMVVIAGVLFYGLRMTLLLTLRQFALRPVAKSLTAAATLLLVTGYLFVTGLPISAVRAYVMIALVLLAVILRRRVDPMRSLSVSALTMLLWDPADLLDPGFQLSFAATMALIAIVQSRWLRRGGLLEGAPRLFQVYEMLRSMVLLSIAAELATAPIAIAQFNNFSIYGILANLLATPLVSLFLMPTVALTFILLPFGLHHAALWLMGKGITVLLWIGATVASWPGAVHYLPAPPAWGMVLLTFGLCWVCLWRERGRWFGLGFTLIGLLSFAHVNLPDVVIGGSGRPIAWRTDTGEVLIARGRPYSVLAGLWANGMGQAVLTQAHAPDWRCDAQGCIIRARGRLIALPAEPGAFVRDCAEASLVINTLESGDCAHTPSIGLSQFKGATGVMALWQTPNGWRRQSTRDWQGVRPWSDRTADDDAD